MSCGKHCCPNLLKEPNTDLYVRNLVEHKTLAALTIDQSQVIILCSITSLWLEKRWTSRSFKGFGPVASAARFKSSDAVFDKNFIISKQALSLDVMEQFERAADFEKCSASLTDIKRFINNCRSFKYLSESQMELTGRYDSYLFSITLSWIFLPCNGRKRYSMLSIGSDVVISDIFGDRVWERHMFWHCSL